MVKKIGIDMHVVDGLFQGSRTHVIELFSRVARLCPEIEFICMLDQVETFKQQYPGFDLPNVTLYKLPHVNPIMRLMWQLPILQKKLNLDLIHTQYIIPLPKMSASFVTIHDVLFESHPQYFTWFFRFRSKILMRLSALLAEHVFTVSQFSKQEIIDRYGIDSAKISVTANGASFKSFFPGLADKELIENLGLKSKSYILTVGRLEPRKNHISLFHAYAKLGKETPHLVVVGQKDFGYKEIFKTIEQYGLQEKVIFLQKVSDIELPALYRHAKLFVYPSLAEGFGMPPLEAMASGVPVVVANNTALTEVVENAGELVEATDIDGIATAIQKILSDDSYAMDLTELGLKQARKYAWDSAAIALSQQYKQFLKVSQK